MRGIAQTARSHCEHQEMPLYAYLTIIRTVDSYMLGGKGGYAGGMTADMFCKTSCGRLTPIRVSHVSALTYDPQERRRIVYHKNEVESVWHSWLALHDNDEAREVFREEHRERVRQIESVSSFTPVYYYDHSFIYL